MLTFGDFPGKQRITRVYQLDDGMPVERVVLGAYMKDCHMFLLHGRQDPIARSRVLVPKGTVLVVKEVEP